MRRTTGPIGVFDSGLGGLTVAQAVRELLPAEDLVYLGDTARVPYGTRSAETVIAYARACARHLSRYDIKLLVVACNTVSAVALPLLSVELDLPVVGVITAGARAGARVSQTGRVGVLATAGTVASGAYPRAFAGIDSRVEPHMAEAPLLVPLAEEGWVDGPVPELAAERYLRPLVERGVDALVLGCTHYPVLRTAIEGRLNHLAGRALPVVDSAHATAEELRQLLVNRGLSATTSGKGSLRILVTDRPARFLEVAGRFLGQRIAEAEVTQVDL